jgi:hypothetical protein
MSTPVSDGEPQRAHVESIAYCRSEHTFLVLLNAVSFNILLYIFLFIRETAKVGGTAQELLITEASEGAFPFSKSLCCSLSHPFKMKQFENLLSFSVVYNFYLLTVSNCRFSFSYK